MSIGPRSHVEVKPPAALAQIQALFCYWLVGTLFHQRQKRLWRTLTLTLAHVSVVSATAVICSPCLLSVLQVSPFYAHHVTPLPLDPKIVYPLPRRLGPPCSEAAGTSHDPANPNSVLVDLLVNGQPAPLVLRIPHKPSSAGRERCYDHTNAGEHNLGVGRGGSAAECGGEAGEQGGVTHQELKEEAVAAAAREWCGAFGTHRAEDIAFVEAEIGKAVAAAAVAEATAAAATAAADADAERDQLMSSEAAQDRQRSALGRPEASGLSGTINESSRREGRQEHTTSGEKERKREKRKADRLTITSVLAPDVEKGTTMFWVKVKKQCSGQPDAAGIFTLP